METTICLAPVLAIIECFIINRFTAYKYDQISLLKLISVYLSMVSCAASIGILFLTYYPLSLICLTTVLNSLTLVILYQKVFRQRPILHYIRAIVIVDLLSLYGWNLNNFIYLKFGYQVSRLSVPSCKLSVYFNHIITQSSAWLRVAMCINRYRTLTQTPQRQTQHPRRRVLLIIVFIFLTIALLNLHLPIFTCYYTQNGTKVSGGSIYYPVYPAWSYVNLAVYNIIPFTIMLICNVLIIRHLILLKRTTTLQQSRIRHSSISLPILLSAFLFCIMTTPPAIVYAFFVSSVNLGSFRDILIIILDSVKYTYNSMAFFLYFTTLVEFRTACFRLLRCQSSETDLSAHRMSNPTSGRIARYRTQMVPIAAITK